jgi:hypothetical protein
MIESIKRLLVQHKLFVILLISSITISIAYWTFYTPALFSDDWSWVIEPNQFKPSYWINITDRRPLTWAIFKISSLLFGFKIHYIYVALTIIHILWTIVLYLLLMELLKKEYAEFAIVTSILFLVYPTDYTRMWLTMLAIHIVMLLTLTYMYCLLKYLKEKKFIYYIVAFICLILSIGIYEAQIGIMCVWPLFLLVLYRKLSIRNLFAILFPIIILITFVIWRTIGYQIIGIQDPNLTSMTLSPAKILYNMVLGFKVTLIWGWTKIVMAIVPGIKDVKWALFFLLLITPGILSIFGWRSRKSKDKDIEERSIYGRIIHRWASIRLFGLLGVSGLVLIGAGYVPIIVSRVPSLAGHESRTNLFASLGGSLFIISVLYLGALILTTNRIQIKKTFVVASMFFIALGIMTIVIVQNERKIAWQEQKTIWQALFEAAPNFEDGTNVVIIIPGYQDRVGWSNWKRTPLNAYWEVTSALRVFYNNPTLTGDVIYPDIDSPSEVFEPVLRQQGIMYPKVGIRKTYTNSVFFYYDPIGKEMSILYEFPAKLIMDANNPIALDTSRILYNNITGMDLRWLVTR